MEYTSLQSYHALESNPELALEEYEQIYRTRIMPGNLMLSQFVEEAYNKHPYYFMVHERRN